MGNHGLSVALFCYVLLWLTHAHEGHGPHAAHVAHVAKQHRKKTPEVHVLTQFAAAKTAIHQKCAQLEKLMNRERAVEHILEQQEEKFKHVQELSEEEKLNAVGALRVHRRQLEKSSSLVDDALQILTLMLNNITYLDFGHMKDTSEKMNKILAESAADAEDISNKIDALGAQNKVILDVKGKSNATRTGMDDVVNFLLRDITGSVDQLQDQIHGHETKTFEREKHTEGSQLETVVRIDPTESHGANSTSKSHKHHGGKGHEGIVTTLIDTKNNQYTLRRPTDTTLHYEDISLMNDVILVLIMAFVGGSICSFIGMPTFFGYVITGIFLSPTGLNKLENIVQVETLSGFGVFFILFLLGLDFSFPKLLAVWRVSVFGGGILMCCNLAASLALGYMNSKPITDGILIGFCISLSSTAIVLKCLEPSENLTKYGSALLGILIVQDVALGIMLAMLPVLHASGDAILSTLASAVAGFLAVSVLAAFVGWKVLPPVLNFLKRSQELYLLCAICVMMTMLKVTEYLGLSMELGCFIAGLMISTHPDQADYTVHIVEPIRDMFACIFFVTMGLHIYPSFLLSQVGGLLFLTATVVLMKYASAFSLFAFYYRYDYGSASLVALGLSQISEFSFVLASHGRQLGIISREAYFLLLGTTALSFLSTPFLWYLSKRVLPPAFEPRLVASDEDVPSVQQFERPIT